jgi:uncharacterized protein (DUF39 family)
MKTQGEINAKIRDGTALVMTAADFKRHIREGDTITPEEVDVVTTGTFGVMSGTYTVLSILVAEKAMRDTYCRLIRASYSSFYILGIFTRSMFSSFL